MMMQELGASGLLRAQAKHRRRRIPLILPVQPVQSPPALHVGNRLDVKDKQVHFFQNFKIHRKDAKNAKNAKK